jgi:arsenate reductase-like glutaredoxin family protein
VDARKVRIGEDDLAELFDGASKILVAKGKQTVVLDLKRDPIDDDELASLVLGRSGNLRAPAARSGKTWVVGYGDATWEQHFH